MPSGSGTNGFIAVQEAPFLLGFLLPLLALATGSANAPWRNEWLCGVLFGLPFLTFYVLLGAIWAFRGRPRLREFVFYAERKMETNIFVCHTMGVPIAVLGVASLVLTLS
ncbi:hypothetical protein [Bradyrhizobium sp. HKCCYLR20261]|uniref:hypothetical protein n=1 Tax=Bradyrhizobium sp. HKCCYLR20261 TaxID=3420760 RepID=UPI003EB8FD56